ncbi:hypothetical protein RB24_16820, partial [Herbaspirillum rubrisubalbicans]
MRDRILRWSRVQWRHFYRWDVLGLVHGALLLKKVGGMALPWHHAVIGIGPGIFGTVGLDYRRGVSAHASKRGA